MRAVLVVTLCALLVPSAAIAQTAASTTSAPAPDRHYRPDPPATLRAATGRAARVPKWRESRQDAETRQSPRSRNLLRHPSQGGENLQAVGPQTFNQRFVLEADHVGQTASVTLQARDNITFSDAVTLTNAGAGLTAQAGGNITMQVGDQGILLVDTQYAQLSDKILAAIRKISNKPSTETGKLPSCSRNSTVLTVTRSSIGSTKQRSRKPARRGSKSMWRCWRAEKQSTPQGARSRSHL